jgi:hypothetical protein
MTPEIPNRYSHTELVLMVVHPLLLFAYWEVTPESCQQAQNALGPEMDGARAVIRMYDISMIHFDGTNAHHVFDVDVGLEAPGWYLHLWTAEKSYCGDLGFLARTGRFHPLTRSNIVHTPRAAPSWRRDEQWMRIRFMRRRKPDRARPMELVPPPEIGIKLSPEELRLQRERIRQGMTEGMAGYMSGARSSEEARR